MINMISQLVPQPQQGTGANASLTANQRLPVAVVTVGESRQEVLPEVQGGMDLPSREELSGAIDQLNGYLDETQHGLRFSVDENSGRTIVRVIDTETEEVIRQIPSEEMLVLIRHFNEMTGNLFDAVA